MTRRGCAHYHDPAFSTQKWSLSHRGQHQEPDQAQPPEREAARRQQDRPLELRTRTKSAVTAAETGAETAADAERLAMKRIDKAATKGVIHKNAAARRKSRLAKRLAAASADS